MPRTKISKGKGERSERETHNTTEKRKNKNPLVARPSATTSPTEKRCIKKRRLPEEARIVAKGRRVE